MISQTALTIYEQLGGRRFSTMTGAKNLVGGPDALQFRIPAAKNGINFVIVTLTPNDTYTVGFWAVRGSKIKVVATHEGIYADMLQNLFTEETGLATRL